MDELLKEIARLRRRVGAIRKAATKACVSQRCAVASAQIFDLEQENDLLAVENERLRSLPVGGAAPCPTNAGPSTADKDAAGGSSIFGSWDEHSYLQGGTETFSMTETATVQVGIDIDAVLTLVIGMCAPLTPGSCDGQGAGNGLNPLCCRLAVIGGRRVGFVGGVDKMVTAFSIDGNEKSIGSVAGFTVSDAYRCILYEKLWRLTCIPCLGFLFRAQCSAWMSVPGRWGKGRRPCCW